MSSEKQTAPGPKAYDVRTTGRPSVVSFAGLQITPAVQRIPAKRLNAQQLKKLAAMPGVEVKPFPAEDK